MMVTTNLQPIITILSAILYGVISPVYAAVSITSNTDGAAVCPGQELVLTCVAENTVALRWRVFSSLHSSSFIEKTFTRRSNSGTRDTEGVFTFTLVSKNNNRYESLLMTVATQSLHNTVIECHSISLISSFTIKIESAPKGPVNISSMVQEYQSISSTVEISWNPPLIHDPQVDYYHYELMGRSHELLVVDGNTSNTSAILEDIPYNRDLIFSLSAVNCVRSSPITYYHINVVGCPGIDSFSLQMSSNFSPVPGTNLSLSCVHNQNIQITITCQDNGKWEPNPYMFSSLCNIKDNGISEKTEMIPTAIVTNVTVANDNESFAKLLHMYRYVIIPASASAFLIIASLSVLIMVVICIYQVRKRRRQAKCRNLERQYECVDEPIYEMIPNEPNVNELIYEMIPNNNYPKTGEWSDFNTNCNEAYQKSHHVLRYGSDTIIINSNN